MVGISRDSKNFDVTAIKIISESVAHAYKIIELCGAVVAEAFIFIRAIAAERITSHT
jgi:hypothetical protein